MFSLHATDREEIYQLPCDSYSMLMIAPLRNQAFGFSVAVFTMQLLVYGFVFWYLAQSEEAAFFLNPVPEVDVLSRFFQFVAYVIAIATQDDIMKSADTHRMMLSRKLYTEFLLSYKNDGGTMVKIQHWVASMCRFLVGIFGLMISMVIIIQSDNLSDLFKDFAAMSFLSILDDLAHIFAKEGVFGFEIQRVAVRVSRVRIIGRESGGTMIKRRILVFMLIVLTSLLVGFTIAEANGHYLPKSITLQIGDDENFSLQAHNGEYERLGVDMKHARRFVYKEKNDNGSRRGYVVYCKKQKFWGLLILNNLNLTNIERDCVHKVMMYSGEDKGFDISAVSTDGWRIKKGYETYVLTSLEIYQNDCKTDSYCGIPYGGKFSGTCKQKRCVCEKGFYGERCRYRGGCRIVELADRSNNFEGIAEKFYAFDNLRFNNQLVYVHNEKEYHIILYTGTRWIILRSSRAGFPAIEEFPHYFKTFHLNKGRDFTQLVDFMSEPTTGSSLVDLQWYHHSELTPARFICAECTTFVGNTGCLKGTCNRAYRSCKCRHGYSGGRCHVPPVKGRLRAMLEMDGTVGSCRVCPEIEFQLDEEERTMIWFDTASHGGGDANKARGVNLTYDHNQLLISPTDSSIVRSIPFPDFVASPIEKVFQLPTCESKPCNVSEISPSDVHCIQEKKVMDIDACTPLKAKTYLVLHLELTPPSSVAYSGLHWKYPSCESEHLITIGDGYCDPNQNMSYCAFDGSDCITKFDYSKCIANLTRIRDGHCDGGRYNTEECNFDGGDCMSLDLLFPACPKTLDILRLGNGICDASIDEEYNTPLCGHDGGDCLEYNMWLECKGIDTKRFADGVCDGPINTEACGYDGGDCLDFNTAYPDCKAEKPTLIGDGTCNEKYNTLACKYDGFDCGFIFKEKQDLEKAVGEYCDGKGTERYGPIKTWNVREILDMSKLLVNQKDCNPDISKWDVSLATSFRGMFRGARSFDQPVGTWNVSSGVDFYAMFFDAHSFDQDVGDWDVSNGSNFGLMFERAISFDQDLGNWDVSNGNDFNSMFAGASAFNSDLERWNVSVGRNFGHMFYKANSFNRYIGDWDVSGGTSFASMFAAAASFNQDIGDWDVSIGTTFKEMFYQAPSFNQAIGRWNVSNGDNFAFMFREATLFNQDLTSWVIKNDAMTTWFCSNTEWSLTPIPCSHSQEYVEKQFPA